MLVRDLISITELSRITNKSRPTLYKYLNDYHIGKYDEIPYSFIIMFDMIEKNEATKSDIINYCRKTYSTVSNGNDAELDEIVGMLTRNRDKLNLTEIKKLITERIEE
ncbi:MAG: hypothetical protein J6C09_00630 [Clostridia bacterium]|nr:hypothetical protein [Clostridia bacterium]